MYTNEYIVYVRTFAQQQVPRTVEVKKLNNNDKTPANLFITASLIHAFIILLSQAFKPSLELATTETRSVTRLNTANVKPSAALPVWEQCQLGILTWQNTSD